MNSKLFLNAILGLSMMFSAVGFSGEENWGAYIGMARNSEDSRVRPEVFLPIVKSDDGVIFIDLRNVDMLQNGDKLNISFGMRKKYDDTILGVNANYDTYRSENGNEYTQNGLGFEVLREDISLRVNFYSATGTTKNDLVGTGVPLYARLNGSKFELVDKRDTLEGSLGGYDFELGAVLAKEEDRNLKGYLGAWHRDSNSELQGSDKYYAELEVNQELLGGTLSFNIRKEAGKSASDDLKLGIGYSFGRDDNADLDSMMLGHVRRDDKIFITTKEFETNVYEGCTELYGKKFCEITILDADDDVPAAVKNAGDDSLVLLRGDKGDIIINGVDYSCPVNVYSGIELQEGQVLLGEGRAFTIVGPQGQKAVLIVKGERATVVDRAYGFSFAPSKTILMANNSALADIDLEGPMYEDESSIGGPGMYYFNAKLGVQIKDVKDVIIDNISAKGYTVGANIKNSENVTIKSSTFSQNLIGIRVKGQYDYSGIGPVTAPQPPVPHVPSFTTKDVNLENNTLTDNFIGIRAVQAERVSMTGNSVSNSFIGISGRELVDSSISGTTATGNFAGIVSIMTLNLNYNNNTTNENGIGVVFVGGSNVSGTGNTAQDNGLVDCIAIGTDMSNVNLNCNGGSPQQP